MNRLLLTIVFCFSSNAFAESVQVVVSEQPPFVMNKGHNGYAIELWQLAAEHAEIEYTIKSVANGAERRKLAANNPGVVAVGANSITAEREALMDFSHPLYKTGQSLMYHPSKTIVRVANGVDGIILWFLVLIFVAGHLIWVGKRRGFFYWVFSRCV